MKKYEVYLNTKAELYASLIEVSTDLILTFKRRVRRQSAQVVEDVHETVLRFHPLCWAYYTLVTDAPT